VVARVELLQLGKRHLVGARRAVAHTADVRVMEQHRHTVGGDLHVALDCVRAECQAVLEREECVLGCSARGPAMPEDHRSGRLEVRVGHRRYVNMRPPMAVLTRDVILREIESGRVVIDPFSEDQVGVASIDLTLGDEIRVIEPDGAPLEIRDETDFREHTTVESLCAKDGFVLDPGVTIHGITLEKVTLPADLCGFLEGRSRFARLGLMVHVTSAFVQPGVSNRQVLEMSNVSSRALRVHAGVRVCQLVLMRTDGTAVYEGRFADQEEI
jgi:dCTP deaminase